MHHEMKHPAAYGRDGSRPIRLARKGALVAVALLAVGLAACSSSSSSSAPASSSSASSPGTPVSSSPITSSPAKKTFNVALLVFDTTNPWVGTLVNGAQAEAKKQGIALTVYNAALNNATQLSQMQQAIASHVDAILLEAADPNGIVPGIVQANAANIPVIAVNAGVNKSAKIVTYISADQYTYGVDEAKLVEQALPHGGTVALVQGQIGNAIEAARTQAIKDTLGKDPKYKIVASVTDSWTTTGDLSAVQDLLSRFPKGKLGAVVAEGPQIYKGAQYAHSVGRDDIKFIGGDFPVQVKSAIQSGLVYGTVLQDGGVQGSTAVDAAELWLSGLKAKVQTPTWYLPLPLVTMTNVSQFTTSWNA